MTIVTGVYLFSKETDSYCSYGEIDVSERFNNLLIMYFAFYITDFVRDIAMVTALKMQNRHLACFYWTLVLNFFFGFACLITNHVYRVGDAGSYCAGTWDS